MKEGNQVEGKLQGSEIRKGEDLGSIVQSSGDHGKEVKKHVSAAWYRWRNMSARRIEKV